MIWRQRADDVARCVLIETGTPSRPPVDVEAVALAMGVTSVERRPLMEDGRLVIGGGSVRIEVAHDVSPQRQRFTIAHELGHLLLADAEDAMISYRARPRSADHIERFCDAFAAALLLPAPWTRSRVGRPPFALDDLCAVATETDVSLTATFHRVVDVLGWDTMLVRFERRSPGWSIAAVYRPPRWLRRRLEAGARTTRLLDRLVRTRAGEVSVGLPLVVAGRTTVVAAQLRVRRDDVLAMIAPSAVAAAALHMTVPDGGVQLRFF